MAPVGSRESLAAALASGADAVYFGIGGLNMRSRSSANFTLDDMEEIAATCAAAGVKSYLTVNTVLFDSDMEQMHAILGDAKISNRKLTSVYKEGIDAYEVGVIPSAADQLLLGSLGRSKARSIRALIILGAANGHFPAVYGDDGMIDDEERASLAQMGLGEMPSTAQLNDKEFGDAYGAVTKPTDKLWLSYTMGSGSDTATPCELMDRIADMFGDVSIKTDIEEESASTAPSAYSALIKHLRTGVENGHIDARAGELYAALHKDSEYARKLASLSSALFPSVSAEPLGEDAAHRLYGARLSGGITSIEKFNGCPFKHFASVGLKLTPRKEYRERKADEGLFCHEAMSLLTKELIAMGKGDGSITNDQLETLLDSVLPKLIAQHNNGVLMDTARSRAAAEFCARHLGWDTVHCTSGDAMRSIEEIQQEVQQLARKTLG